MVKLKKGDLIVIPDFIDKGLADVFWGMTQDGGLGGLLARVECVDIHDKDFTYGFIIRNSKNEWIENDMGQCNAFWIENSELGTPQKLQNQSFKNDVEKMFDYDRMSKEEFLKSYSYLTELDYMATRLDIRESGL